MQSVIKMIEGHIGLHYLNIISSSRNPWFRQCTLEEQSITHENVTCSVSFYMLLRRSLPHNKLNARTGLFLGEAYALAY